MTKPTAGVPHHPPPVITRVEFETTAGPDTTPAGKFAAQFQARTVGHLDDVNVGLLLGLYLEDLGEDFSSLPPERKGETILSLIALIDTVIEQCKQMLANRMVLDIATTLLPRLKGTRSV